ncbi:hypothetical protein ACFQS1_26600 [Paractinoplanes rhizophilus]|uniref:DUF222 domain-containing protein n=1 Tax=Paractinoplanes rhizophilus TaxID=1416877 RepID=A0ABW2HWN9_9ACTN
MMTELQQLGEDAAKLAAIPVWPLPDDDITDALHAAHRLEQTAMLLQARLVHHATGRGIPTAQGYRSTTRWLAALLALDPHQARDLAEAATALHHPAIGQAVLDGRANLRQAAVIAATIDAIPADLALLNEPTHPADPDSTDPSTDPGSTDGTPRFTPDDVTRIIDEAERTMIEMAGRLPAYQLRRVGDRILTHIAPTWPTKPTKPPSPAKKPAPIADAV